MFLTLQLKTPTDSSVDLCHCVKLESKRKQEEEETQSCVAAAGTTQHKNESLYVGRSPPAGPGDLLKVGQRGNKSSTIQREISTEEKSER